MSPPACVSVYWNWDSVFITTALFLGVACKYWNRHVSFDGGLKANNMRAFKKALL